MDYKKSIIDEALHYPDFLDKLKFEFFNEILSKTSEMIKAKTTDYDFIYRPHYQMVENAVITIELNFGKDINNERFYSGFSNSNEKLTEGGETETVFLSFVFPVSKEGKINESKIRIIVSHEVGHLYDDWNDMTRGGNGLFVSKKASSVANFMKHNNKNSNILLRSISWLCYFSLYTENNSFVMQLMDELESYNANQDNIIDSFKKTIAYKNLKETEKEFFGELEKVTDFELFNINRYIIINHPYVNVPKMNLNQFESVKYIQMLKKWGERIIHNTSKRYYGIIQLYMDRLSEKESENNCFYVR